MGKKTQKKTNNMSSARKKARIIRFIETVGTNSTVESVQCVACGACCAESYFLSCDYWIFDHADKMHKNPQTLRRPPARFKDLPLMAKRATPEEYRKLKKQARRRRQFKGIKDKSEGSSLRWM